MADDTNNTEENWDGDWVALLPVTLDNGCKRILDCIASGGDPAALGDRLLVAGNRQWLENRGLLRSEMQGKKAVHQLTDYGKLFLKRCTEATDDSMLPVELPALFNCLDEPDQRRFAHWAASMLDMELIPETGKDE